MYKDIGRRFEGTLQTAHARALVNAHAIGFKVVLVMCSEDTARIRWNDCIFMNPIGYQR